MPHKNDRSMQDFSKYDAMTSEELAQLLRLDSEAPEGNELDIDTLLYITGVLAEREKSGNSTGKTAQESWISFQKNYLPLEEAYTEPVKETKPVKSNPLWVRRAVAAAAAIILIVLIPLTAKALNCEKLWNVVAAWAKETFSFIIGDREEYTDPTPRDINQYNSLQDAVNSSFAYSVKVPTWVPDGYALDEIRMDENPDKSVLIAYYTSKEKELIVQVKSYIQIDSSKMEIAESIIEIYQPSNIEYYIYKNREDTCTVWVQDSFECYISGALTVDEIKAMIDSIGKG